MRGDPEMGGWRPGTNGRSFVGRAEPGGYWLPDPSWPEPPTEQAAHVTGDFRITYQYVVCLRVCGTRRFWQYTWRDWISPYRIARDMLTELLGSEREPHRLEIERRLARKLKATFRVHRHEPDFTISRQAASE